MLTQRWQSKLKGGGPAQIRQMDAWASAVAASGSAGRGGSLDKTAAAYEALLGQALREARLNIFCFMG